MTGAGQEGSGGGPGKGRGGGTQIFICDASAEGGRLLNALQAKGYAIVDVPLGLLPSRILYDVPHVVICDADAREAKRLLTETMDVAGDRLSVVLIGAPDGPMTRDPQLRKFATETIGRPVDLDTALDKVSQLVGPPSRGSHRPRIGLSSRAPVLVASARKPYRSDGYQSDPPSSRPSQGGDESLWPIDSPPSRGPSPVDSSRFAYEGSAPRHMPSSTPPSSDRLSLSSETRAVLEEGRKRVKAYSAQSPRPIRLPALAHSGGDDIREEFLQALEEPLDEDMLALTGEQYWPREGTSSGDDGPPTHPGGKSEAGAPPGSAKTHGTYPHSAPLGFSAPSEGEDDDDDESPEEERTNPGGKPPTQPPGDLDNEDDDLLGDAFPAALDDLSDLLTPRSSHPPDSLPAVSVQTERPGRLDSHSSGQLLATIPPPTRRPMDNGPFRSEIPTGLPLSRPTPSLPAPRRAAREVLPTGGHRPMEKPKPLYELGSANAMIRLAQAVSERQTGAVAQQEGVGLRRIVLTDGDISTATSTLEGESLSRFLRSRGDISEEVLGTLGSIPTFGRHAGAALIARGLLQQEDLWPVLRAHAEWVMAQALLSDAETLFEESVPARVLEEPAVFGGAAGTEIYLETIRRIVSSRQAFALLGSPDQILSTGKHESLLGESALTQSDQLEVLECVGKSIGATMEKRPEMMPILLALTYLDVFSTGGEVPAAARPPVQVRSDEMDDDAFIARVSARRALVEDGDYFGILGISRSATAYEVDRACEELLAEFADQKLTPRTAHLQKDLALLRATIQEAHLVLHDDVRRMRYRAAIEAVPLAGAR